MVSVLRAAKLKEIITMAAAAPSTATTRINSTRDGLLYVSSQTLASRLEKCSQVPAYYCDSWACRKVTHVCVMTLSNFIFSLVEVHMMRGMVEDLGSKVPVLVKAIQYSVGLVFVVYEGATQKTPGAGTTALVVFAALAEILLIFLEFPTFCKNSQENRQMSSDVEGADADDGTSVTSAFGAFVAPAAGGGFGAPAATTGAGFGAALGHPPPPQAPHLGRSASRQRRRSLGLLLSHPPRVWVLGSRPRRP